MLQLMQGGGGNVIYSIKTNAAYESKSKIRLFSG